MLLLLHNKCDFKKILIRLRHLLLFIYNAPREKQGCDVSPSKSTEVHELHRRATKKPDDESECEPDIDVFFAA